MSSILVNTLNEGDILFLKGDTISDIYIIKTGEIGLFWEKEKHLVPYKIIKAKELIGEEAIFTYKSWAWTAVALSPQVQYIPLEKKEVLSSLKAKPAWVESIIKILCERLADTEEIIQEHNIVDDLVDTEFEMTEKMENFYKRKISEHRQSRIL